MLPSSAWVTETGQEGPGQHWTQNQLLVSQWKAPGGKSGARGPPLTPDVGSETQTRSEQWDDLSFLIPSSSWTGTHVCMSEKPPSSAQGPLPEGPEAARNPRPSDPPAEREVREAGRGLQVTD